MNFELFHMHIIEKNENSFNISISQNNNSCLIQFSPEHKNLRYIDCCDLTQTLKLREFQLRKLLHNKRPETYKVGFKLNFVLHDGLPDIAYYDKSKITIIDNTDNDYIVSKSNRKLDKVVELFSDGSYNEIKEKGAFAIVIKENRKEGQVYTKKVAKKGNNLIELAAVNFGLSKLQDYDKVRIITDSQYVIKGASEWLPLWKLNDYMTANGTKAKNIEEWQLFDTLIKNKYIEFEWVKAHSNHKENTICHKEAKSLIQNKPNNEKSK